MQTRPDPRNVLVAVGGSASDRDAVDWAVAEATHRSLPLRLVHVVELPEVPEDLSTQVMARYGKRSQRVVDAARELVARVEPRLPVEQVVRVGSVVPILLAEAMDAAIVVIGSGQRVDPAHVRLGSVAVHVTAHAVCPVLVARTPLEGEPVSGPSAGRVVVGTDGSAVSQDAVGFAFEEAAWRGVGLTVVHAWRAGTGGSAEQKAGALLAASLSGWRGRYPAVPVMQRVLGDHPARALVEESAGALLLVVGCHGRGRFAGMLLGSVSQALLRHAPTSVAVVRPHPKSDCP